MKNMIGLKFVRKRVEVHTHLLGQSGLLSLGDMSTSWSEILFQSYTKFYALGVDDFNDTQSQSEDLFRSLTNCLGCIVVKETKIYLT